MRRKINLGLRLTQKCHSCEYGNLIVLNLVGIKIPAFAGMTFPRLLGQPLRGCVKIFIIFFFLTLFSTNLYSLQIQEDSLIPKPICPECIAKLMQANDSTRTEPNDSSDFDINTFFKKLEIDSTDKKFDIDSREKFDILMSYGWFPSPLRYWNISIALYGGWLYEAADNINPKGLKNVYTYQGATTLDDDERTMKKKFSNDDGEDYPVKDVDQYGLEYSNTFSLPLIFRFGAYYTARDGMLFSDKTEKPFLTHGGNLINFSEASMVFIQEKGISLKFGLDLPIYGAFQDFTVFSTNSFYYLHAGALIDYILSSKATQFIQILNNKDKVRYYDGLDTLDLATEISLPGLNKTRYYLDLALGMEISTGSFGVKIEAFWTMPFTSIIKEASWKQNIFGMRTAIDVGFTYTLLKRLLTK